MKLIFVILIIFVLMIYILNYLISQKKKSTYLKAGKKWDGIVEELSRRK